MTHVTWVNKDLFPRASGLSQTKTAHVKASEDAESSNVQPQHDSDVGVQGSSEYRRVYLQALSGTTVAIEERVFTVCGVCCCCVCMYVRVRVRV